MLFFFRDEMMPGNGTSLVAAHVCLVRTSWLHFGVVVGTGGRYMCCFPVCAAGDLQGHLIPSSNVGVFPNSNDLIPMLL